MSHAYKYRLEQYSGKICYSNLSLASIKSTAESCPTEPNRMCYLPEACYYIPLSFPFRFLLISNAS